VASVIVRTKAKRSALFGQLKAAVSRAVAYRRSLHGIVASPVQRLLCELANDPSTVQSPALSSTRPREAESALMRLGLYS
jgi:hypothetical protein